MKLELLYFDDCPNWKVAAERLEKAASGRGLTVERRLVTTPEEGGGGQVSGLTGDLGRRRGPIRVR